MFSKLYFDLGLSKEIITDDDIIKAFSISKKSARHIQTLVNARNNENNYNAGNVFCEYCDVDRERPLNISTFNTFCDNYEMYKQNHNLYFYYKERVANPMTTDHINPKILGGSLTDPWNMAVCCQSCNKVKGSKTFAKFVLYMQEHSKYKRFLEKLDSNLKFVSALNFTPKKITYIMSDEIEDGFIDADDTIRENNYTLDPKVGIEALHWKQTNELLIDNDKCFAFINTKVKSLAKFKSSQLIKLNTILSDENLKTRYIELLSQRFDISNYDFELLHQKVNELILNRKATIPEEMIIGVELDYSENGHFVKYGGTLEPFNTMEIERVKTVLKSVTHCMRINSTRFIPPMVRILNLDFGALHNALVKRREQLLNEKEN